MVIFLSLIQTVFLYDFEEDREYLPSYRGHHHKRYRGLGRQVLRRYRDRHHRRYLPEYEDELEGEGPPDWTEEDSYGGPLHHFSDNKEELLDSLCDEDDDHCHNNIRSYAGTVVKGGSKPSAVPTKKGDTKARAPAAPAGPLPDESKMTPGEKQAYRIKTVKSYEDALKAGEAKGREDVDLAGGPDKYGGWLLPMKLKGNE